MYRTADLWKCPAAPVPWLLSALWAITAAGIAKLGLFDTALASLIKLALAPAPAPISQVKLKLF